MQQKKKIKIQQGSEIGDKINITICTNFLNVSNTVVIMWLFLQMALKIKCLTQQYKFFFFFLLSNYQLLLWFDVEEESHLNKKFH